MFGSIHTHFESKFDTANFLPTMVKEFHDLGCKKIAVTDHGVMLAYEDLKDIVNDPKHPEYQDMEIIPGVEGYFGDDRAHVVLIAKNEAGYHSLCRVVSEAAQESEAKAPIITLENLRRNISKGNVICTTACIAGIFGRELGLTEKNLDERITKIQKAITNSNAEEVIAIEQEYKELLDFINQPLKKKRSNAEKAAAYGNIKALQAFNELEAEINAKKEYLEANSDKYLTNHQLHATLGRRKIPSMMAELPGLIEQRQQFKPDFETCEKRYADFADIFGKDDFYFELQNHGLESERTIYNNIIELAKRVGHTNFIASNDIHIGVSGKDKERLNTEVQQRNIMMYNRFKKYHAPEPDEYEYYIKDDDELRDALKQIISDDSIIDSAINNIENVLTQCHIEEKEEKHYPKFCDDEIAEFDALIQKGIKQRFPNGLSPEYQERLDYEIDVIKKMGYVGYFLIVQDYLHYGRLLGYLPPDMVKDAPLTIPDLINLLNTIKPPKVGYSIGPGRGSGAGSLACYMLGITDIDPMPYNLLFERFLNVERVSMPDIDSDFRTDIRDKVVEYCKARYGWNNTCQIMTKTYGGAKGNIRLIANYLGTKEYYDAHPEEVATLTDSALDTNVKKSLRSTGWYRAADLLAKAVVTDEDGIEHLPEEVAGEKENQILAIAQEFEHFFMNSGQHAAGTVISGVDLRDYMPLMKGFDDVDLRHKEMQTQCTMAQAENKGFLKMDLLSLKTLDIITEICRRNTYRDFGNLAKRDEMLHNQKLYSNIIGAGNTQGVFQIESTGMVQMLRKFRPSSFEDIILLVSAYRPGPMDYIPEMIVSKWAKIYQNDAVGFEKKVREIFPFSQKEYAERKAAKLAYFYDEYGNFLPNFEKSISVKCDALTSILEPTYGVPIYQEQIMQIFQHMAGYSLGGADLVRRAMSKKKKDKLMHEKEAFIYGDEKRGIPGCIKKQGITAEEADLLFEQMMPFAAYGFNKSHATVYSFITMMTAQLKYTFPEDFYAVNLLYEEKHEKRAPMICEMQKLGIELLPPSVSTANSHFVKEGRHAVRYGISDIKSVSNNLQLHMGTSITNFIRNNPKLNQSTFTALVRAGALDELDSNRQKLLAWADTMVRPDPSSDKEISNYAVLQSIFALEANSELDAKQTDKLQQYRTCYRPIHAFSNIQKDIIKCRQDEIDALGYALSVQDDLTIIKAQPRQLFRDMQDGDAWVNAVVLSISDQRTDKYGKKFYEVELMDASRETRKVRFDAPPTCSCGTFKIPAKWYWISTAAYAKSLSFRHCTLKSMPSAAELNALSVPNGTVQVTIYTTPGVSFTSTPEKLQPYEKFYHDGRGAR